MKKALWLVLAILGLSWNGNLRFPLQPAHFPEPVYAFAHNPFDSHKVALGRMLFYDPRLSVNGQVSCASCHSVYNAFAHTDHALSHGIYDRIGRRNAPALMNLAWQPVFMWDGAINHLDMQSLAPLAHPDEMGSSLAAVVDTLNSQKLYRSAFAQAFGDSIATGERVLKSFAQFMLSLVSADSKYDRMKQGKVAFSAQENRGYALYQSHCASCHAEPLFSTYRYANNGLPLNPELNDVGRAAISQQSSDSFQFKIPSLRNLNYSYPYMHDGRFRTLREVLNHYSGGVRNSGSMPATLSQGLPLNTHEKTDLIAFLLTLSDSAFVYNRNLAFPTQLLPPSTP